MARSKLKVTGFTRFLLFLLIAAPCVFVLASYINGEDGLQNLKNLFSGQLPNSEIQAEQPAEQPTKAYVNSEIQRLQDELEEKEKKIKELYLENEQLREQAAEAKAEMESFREQLKKIKTAIGQ